MVYKMLNLGCGNDIKEGWVNADKYIKDKGIVNMDINKKFPFKDNSFDYVYSRFTLEHGHDSEHMFRELYRILKPEGQLEIIVPHVSGYIEGQGDVGHHTFFSFLGLQKLDRADRDYYLPFRFEVVHREFWTAPSILRRLYNKYPHWAERYWCRLFPILCMRVVMKVRK